MSQNKLTNPIARVRGHGSAHDGTHHFWVQRLSAVGLVPLMLWFVASVVCQIGQPYVVFTEWLGSLPAATGMILTILLGFWHASLGLQVVIEDYIHAASAKFAALIIMKLTCFVFALVGVLAVLKVVI